MSRRVFLTGATGFLGVILARQLLAQGWEVDALVRPGGRERLPNGVFPVEVPGTSAAIQSHLECRPALAVVHLATCYVRSHRPDQIADILEANVSLSVQLLEAMVATNHRYLVQAGTTFQHFEGASGRAVNLYAASKEAAEVFSRWYAEAHQLSILSLHLPDTYGPGDPRVKLFTLLQKAALAGETLAMTKGEQVLDLLHCEDAADAFRQAVEFVQTMSSGFQVFGVSSGEPLSLRALIDLWQSLGGPTPTITFGGRPYAPREHMSPHLPRLLPDWRPGRSLVDGLRSIIPPRAT